MRVFYLDYGLSKTLEPVELPCRLSSLINKVTILGILVFIGGVVIPGCYCINATWK